MKKSIFGGLSAAVLSLTLVHTVPVYAMHEDCPMKQCMMIKKLDAMKAELALTPEQERKLNTIKEKNKMFMLRKHKEKHMMSEEADQIAEAKDIDKTKLDKLADKACQLKKETVKHRVMTKHAVNQILTPEQKEKIKEAMRKDVDNHMQMMKKDMMQQNMAQ